MPFRESVPVLYLAALLAAPALHTENAEISTRVRLEPRGRA
jgi:hypothetical protein